MSVDGPLPAMPAPSSSSPQPTTTSIQKRKRTDSNDPDTSTPAANIGPRDPQEAIQDVWHVMQNYDDTSSVLSHLSPTAHNKDAENGKPSAKRQKLSDDATTIAEKVEKRQYTSLEDFATDLLTAASSGLEAAEANAPITGTAAWNYNPVAAEQEHRRLAARVSAFKKYVSALVSREKQDVRPKAETNGVKSEDHETNGLSATLTDDLQVTSDKGRAVLTLYGNAQGPKQLFSSFQRPLSRLRQSTDPESSRHVLSTSSDAVMPLREDGLPNGLFSANILPTSADDVAPATRKGQTFADVFHPPSSIPQLAPPKSSRHGHARGDTITFTKDALSSESSRQSGYTNEKLPAGQWLGYGGVTPVQEPVSPEAKRKRRDRALSTGEAVLTPNEGLKAAQMQAREDALFKSVYSSFAPCRDNTAALISEEEKRQVWWYRYGKQCFEQTFAIDPALYESPAPESEIKGATEDSADEDALFRKAVDEYEPVDKEATLFRSTKTTEERETEEILAEISEMLEQLHSHQRIRNASLSSNNRSSITQHSSLNDLTGTPSHPSSAEVALYDTLRDQLRFMINLLPPYAVSKLNGEQLADLNISQHIPIEEVDYRGVMEEDQGSKLARQAALTAAVGAASTTSTRPVTATPGGYGSQTRTPAAASTQARPAPAGGYGSYQPGSMARGSSFSRQPLSNWQTPAQSYQNSAQRPPGYIPGAYGTPGAQTGRARPPAAAYSSVRPHVNGTPHYPSRPGGQGYGSAAAAAYAAGSPLQRTASPQTGPYQAPTPQMTRPGSSYYGAQSPSGSAQSPQKPAVNYPTPATGSNAGGSRPQTPQAQQVNGANGS